MALTYSKMTELGSQAPSFTLPISNPTDSGISMVRLRDYANGNPIAVVFMCNHCPFVIHIEEALIQVAQACKDKGVTLIGISSNDATQFPEDSFEAMKHRAMEKQYPFPYLYDETQSVAKAYGAECTPDFFVYDSNLRLAYRGRFDETRPGSAPATGQEFLQAIDELLQFGIVTMAQRPSMGCNIKWK
ncbi:MAG: thioredoxin family protein [Bacteroidetes bacterium]|nr:thioredoxin family protein [Bacteroidota bacterium]MCY4225093.1 thioredoxin family protein [Bacteroidota bacterium]